MLTPGENPLNFKFPIFYEKTRKIIRIFEILKGSKPNSFLSPLLMDKPFIKVSPEAFT